MAKLKLQAEVLSALEHAELLNFSAAQRAVVSTIKSGQVPFNFVWWLEAYWYLENGGKL